MKVEIAKPPVHAFILSATRGFRTAQQEEVTSVSQPSVTVNDKQMSLGTRRDHRSTDKKLAVCLDIDSNA